MIRSNYGSIHENDPANAGNSRWRRAGSTFLHLVLVAMAAAVVGLVLFPLK